MPEIKKVTLGTNENYPKATRRTVNRNSSPDRTAKTSGTVCHAEPVGPRDSVGTGHYDADMAQMDSLRRAGKGRPSLDLGDNYPKALNPDPVAKPAPRPAPKSAPQPKASPTPARPHVAPKQAPSSYAAPPQSNDLAMHQFKDQLALIAAKNKLQDADDKLRQAKKTAPPKAKSKPAQSSKPRVKTNKKLAAGGGVKVVGGILTLKGGVQNLSEGNYVEGGIQVAQGGISVADGARDLNAARQGLSKAPVGTIGKRLNVAGSVLNGAMAVYDTKQAYDAIKSGNEVQASEEMGSAVINAVSAFPPTAIVGAVGGVADWAMEASGADAAMVRSLTRGQTEAYDKRAAEDIQMGQALLSTGNRDLRLWNRSEKQRYIRGINGMREMRRICAGRGDIESVKFFDYQIARVRKALSQ